MRRRAVASITRESPEGRQLLVFTHHVPHAPDAEVPGGYDRAERDPDRGCLARTPRGDRPVAVRPPTSSRSGGAVRADETVEGYFVHLPLAHAAPDAWEHVVTAGELDPGLVFSLFWTTLPDTSGLWPTMAKYVHLLLA